MGVSPRAPGSLARLSHGVTRPRKRCEPTRDRVGNTPLTRLSHRVTGGEPVPGHSGRRAIKRRPGRWGRVHDPDDDEGPATGCLHLTSSITTQVTSRVAPPSMDTMVPVSLRIISCFCFHEETPSTIVKKRRSRRRVTRCDTPGDNGPPGATRPKRTPGATEGPQAEDRRASDAEALTRAGPRNSRASAVHFAAASPRRPNSSAPPCPTSATSSAAPSPRS